MGATSSQKVENSKSQATMICQISSTANSLKPFRAKWNLLKLFSRELSIMTAQVTKDNCILRKNKVFLKASIKLKQWRPDCLYESVCKCRV